MELMSEEVKPTIDELCKKINRKKSTTYNLLKSLRDKGFLK
ncbi:MAG: helix-turn-helix domain-containing protein [Alloprevotella sp.]